MASAQPFEGLPPKERLTAFYEKFSPDKLDKVDANLAKYKGKEDKLWKGLAKKYKKKIEEWRIEQQAAAEETVPVKEEKPLKETETNEHRTQLVAFYTQYAPDKLANVDTTLEKYRGREKVLFAALRKKYKPKKEEAIICSPAQEKVVKSVNNSSTDLFSSEKSKGASAGSSLFSLVDDDDEDPIFGNQTRIAQEIEEQKQKEKERREEEAILGSALLDFTTAIESEKPKKKKKNERNFS